MRSKVITDVAGPTLCKAIAQEVDMAGSTLWTDEGPNQRHLSGEFISHSKVNHSKSQYDDTRRVRARTRP